MASSVLSVAALGGTALVLSSRVLSKWDSTKVVDEIVQDRATNIVQNWKSYTMRSFLEVASWLFIMFFAYANCEGENAFLNTLFAASCGSVSGILVFVAGEVVKMYLTKGEEAKKAETQSNADGNTVVNLFVIASCGYATVSLIFAYFTTVLVTLALATFACIVMVLVGDFFLRLETTRSAGTILQDRIQRVSHNWQHHSMRSAVEAIAWIGAIALNYYFSSNLIAAIQAGTVVGVIAILIGNACEPLEKAEELADSEKGVADKVADILSKRWLSASEKARQTDSPKAKSSKPLKGYTWAEIRKHDQNDDCWLVFEDNVYDLSKWAVNHPGGAKTIYRFAGMDITDELRAFHKDWVLTRQIKMFLIGTVLDPIAPTAVQTDFRKLGAYFESKDYYKKDLSFYFTQLFPIACLFVATWTLVLFSDNDFVHLFAAVLFGLYLQQFAFVGHDTGHMSVNVDRTADWNFGLFVGNFATGLSIGWWKATHNVHHAVPNSVFDDPDIAHLPVFAVSTRIFDSLYNTYHDRVMPFDWAARNIFIPIQHYLYYPIMGLARANLYVQGMIRLVKEPNSYRARDEWLTLAGFYAWMYLLHSQLNSVKMGFAFFLVSHAVAGLLHVQITLSHFSKPVNEGKKANYGGDFYSRNVISSMDVDCSEWMDWFHGGLQFQSLHHCYPRICRKNLRKTLPYIQALCAKHNLPYCMKTFYECNVEIIECLRHAAEKSKTWSPQIADSFNAHG